MTRMPVSAEEQKKIKEEVEALEKELKPDVVRIRYTIEEDYMGDWSIEFRILLADRATTRRRLGTVTQKVRGLLRDRIRPWDLGLIMYWSYRGASEQAELKDPEWE